MKHIYPAVALGLIVGCLGGPLALAQAPQQLVPDLHAYNIQVDYYAPRACPEGATVSPDGVNCASYQALYQTLQKRKMLEELGQFLAPLKWSRTLRLIMKQCPRSGVPTPAVFYDYDEYSLTVCYQFFDDLQSAAGTTQVGGRNASFATRQEAIVGGLVGVVLHEAARAVFDMLQVPILGSNEDAADQLAGLIGLQFGKEVARTVIKGTYLLWNYYDYEVRQNNLPYNFASVSSVAPQRADNILCIAYGGQSATFKDFVDKGLLPPSRAGHCADEYHQAAAAFDKTIKPHVDLAMMSKALTMTWIMPEDLKSP